MIKNSLGQKGSVHVILAVAVVVALVGGLGFVFWQNFHKADTTKQAAVASTAQPAAVGPYKDWQSYNSSKAGYSVKYPKGWSYEEGEPTAAFAAVSFTPEGKTSGVITVSSFRSDLEPKAFVEKNSVNLSVIKSNTDSVNGYDTYYYVSGDGTYVNRSYVIAHEGVITTISMTEKADVPPTDNSMYVNQFDSLAKSLTIKAGQESANVNVMQIKEMGISIIVPDLLRDLTYSYRAAEGSPRVNTKDDNRIVGHVNFSTRSLTDAYPECSAERGGPLGTVTKITGFYKDGLLGPTWGGGGLKKQFDDSFLTFAGAQYACYFNSSQDTQIGVDITKGLNELSVALMNAKEL